MWKLACVVPVDDVAKRNGVRTEHLAQTSGSNGNVAIRSRSTGNYSGQWTKPRLHEWSFNRSTRLIHVLV